MISTATVFEKQIVTDSVRNAHSDFLFRLVSLFVQLIKIETSALVFLRVRTVQNAAQCR